MNFLSELHGLSELGLGRERGCLQGRGGQNGEGSKKKNLYMFKDIFVMKGDRIVKGGGRIFTEQPSRQHIPELIFSFLFSICLLFCRKRFAAAMLFRR